VNQFPFFLVAPPGMPVQPQQQGYGHGYPPARVRMAMDFLAYATDKTAVKLVPYSAGFDNKVDVERVNGQNLTEEERAAQKAACVLLTQYFGGKVKIDVWEEMSLEAIDRTLPPETIPGHSVLVPCHLCQRPGNASCKLCRGAGALVAYPAVGVPEDD